MLKKVKKNKRGEDFLRGEVLKILQEEFEGRIEEELAKKFEQVQNAEVALREKQALLDETDRSLREREGQLAAMMEKLKEVEREVVEKVETLEDLLKRRKKLHEEVERVAVDNLARELRVGKKKLGSGGEGFNEWVKKHKKSEKKKAASLDFKVAKVRMREARKKKKILEASNMYNHQPNGDGKKNGLVEHNLQDSQQMATNPTSPLAIQQENGSGEISIVLKDALDSEDLSGCDLKSPHHLPEDLRREGDGDNGIPQIDKMDQRVEGKREEAENVAKETNGTEVPMEREETEEKGKEDVVEEDGEKEKEKEKDKGSGRSSVNSGKSPNGSGRKKGSKKEKRKEGREQQVVLNVGGRRFETFRSTLTRYPETLLGAMFDERNQSLTANKKEYFFDRNSDAFATILDFYRTAGCLCKPGGLSPRLWKKELDYWAIPPDVDSEFIEEEADEEEQVDEPEFEDQKAEWWQAFRELHPITSTLEVKLDSHNITPIHFNRKEGLLTFIFDQRGELIIGVDGIIVKGSWYATEHTQAKSLEFRKIFWKKREVARYKLIWKEEGQHFWKGNGLNLLLT